MKREKCCNCGNYDSNGTEVARHIEEYNIEYDFYCRECLESVPTPSKEQDKPENSPFYLISDFVLET